MKKIFITVMFALLLTSCGLTEPNEIKSIRKIAKLAEAGLCDEAIVLTNAELFDGPRFYALGAIAKDCSNDPELGLKYMNVSAMMAYEPALFQLIEMGSATSTQKQTYKRLQANKKRKAEVRRARSQELNNALIGMGGCGSMSCMAKGATGNRKPASNISNSASTAFLTKSFIQNGNTMCQYDNGSIINIGVGICPLSRSGSNANKNSGRASTFLTKSFIQNGNTMCRYDNGSIVNIGVGICPLSRR